MAITAGGPPARSLPIAVRSSSVKPNLGITSRWWVVLSGGGTNGAGGNGAFDSLNSRGWQSRPRCSRKPRARHASSANPSRTGTGRPKTHPQQLVARFWCALHYKLSQRKIRSLVEDSTRDPPQRLSRQASRMSLHPHHHHHKLPQTTALRTQYGWRLRSSSTVRCRRRRARRPCGHVATTWRTRGGYEQPPGISMRHEYEGK